MFKLKNSIFYFSYKEKKINLIMLWNKVLDFLECDNYISYPSNIKKPFLWRTSVLDKSKTKPFVQEFIECDNFPKTQNYQSFKKYIEKSKNKYVTSFPNLSGDTMLVVPIPRKNKDYTHLKNFIDQASKVQQMKLWKEVSRVAREMLKKHSQIWISTHGLGVPYLHVRISIKPKYYGKSKMLMYN